MSLLNEKELKNFESKFTKGGKDDCWVWEAARSKLGYGHIRLRRLITKLYRSGVFISSRISKVHYHGGDIYDKTTLACHKCDNPSCVNPDHIFWGTSQDNSSDMKIKGRYTSANQKGDNNANSKLTQKEVKEIKKLLDKNNNKQIAELYKVTHSTISLIRLGKTWKHV